MAVRSLVIDDSPFSRKIIRHHLERLGCQVVGEAEDGSQAIRLVYELKPDLITLDIMMPGSEALDSITILRVIKAAQPFAAILMVSAVPYDQTRADLLEEGALSYVIKPFSKYSFEQVRPKLLKLFPELLAH